MLHLLIQLHSGKVNSFPLAYSSTVQSRIKKIAAINKVRVIVQFVHQAFPGLVLNAVSTLETKTYLSSTVLFVRFSSLIHRF